MQQDLRLYATIGIEGFVVGPPHPLPSEYLQRKKNEDEVTESSSLSTSSFTSWEIVGTIKKNPEDFVVREVLPKKFLIPGLSSEDNERLRVAHIPARVPSQLRDDNLSNCTPNASNGTDNNDTGEPLSTIPQSTKPVVSSSPPQNALQEPFCSKDLAVTEPKSHAEIIQEYLHKVTGNNSVEASQLQEALQCLQDRALNQVDIAATAAARINSENDPSSSDATPSTDDTDNNTPTEVCIPPLPALSPDQANDPEVVTAMKRARGAFHKAIRLQYPCLQTETRGWGKIGTIKDGRGKDNVPTTATLEDHGIRVYIDDSFNDIAPFLLDPRVDLIKLLVFRNRGFEGVRGTEGDNRQRSSGPKPQNSSSLEDDKTCATLRLKPGISKDDRRIVHQSMSTKNKHFETTTTQTSHDDSDHSENIFVLIVRWQKHALMRGMNKRKRKRDSREEGSSNENHSSTHGNLLCVMKKYQKEHLTAMQKLTQSLKCRQTDIGFAGIKDLQAVTYQFITLRNMKKRRTEKANDNHLTRYGITLGLFYNVDFVLNTGFLEGNQFEIILRDLAQLRVVREDNSSCVKELQVECDWDHLRSMFDRVRTSGFINFYGEQRVGSPGPISVVGSRAFDIGKAMLRKDYLKAIHLLMEGSSIRESDEVRCVRKAWKDSNGDPALTLRAFQGADIMAREKAVLKGLNRFPDDPLEALRSLNHNMRMFYVNGYQSYVWNVAASKRIALYGNSVAIGDLYFNSANDDRNAVKVVQTEEERDSVSLSQVVLPLPGYNVLYPENEIGSFYNEIMSRDNITFEKNSIPESTAKGSYRNLIVYPDKMRLEMLQDQKDCAKVSFQLPKGCYATMLLRELMMTTVSRPDLP